MCSTCLTSASLPLIWHFTSSRFSEIRFWISSVSAPAPYPFVCTLLGPVIGLTGSLTHLTLFPSHRKRTMFQNIVNATEPMTDEKEAISFVSNNPIRKEIVMYVTYRSRTSCTCWVSSAQFTLKCIFVGWIKPQRTFANDQHWWQVVIFSPLSVSHLQGHDDDRLWLVGYNQTLGGTEQGGWPSQPSCGVTLKNIKCSSQQMEKKQNTRANPANTH